MDLQKIKKNTIYLTKFEAMQKATELFPEIIYGLKDVYLQTKIFERYSSEPYKFMADLCFILIASNNKISEEEFKLFNTLFKDSGKQYTLQELASGIKSLDTKKVFNLVNALVDFMGEAMGYIKERLVTFAYMFMQADGQVTPDEEQIIKILAK